MARRERAVSLTDAGLDDLFDSVEETTASPRGRRPWLLAATFVTAAVSAVAITLAHAFGFAPPYLLVIAMVAGAVLVRTATVRTREPRGRRTRDLVRPPTDGPDATAAARDGMLAAVGVWDRRLERARALPRDSAPLLAVELAALADERLRQRHGLTRASDPTRAQALLSEPVWATLHRQNRPPSAAELTDVVRRLETL